ncbi:hypothetical protein, partial [Shigella flexneri]|uniref:hypothetical protein n=1 Tax=Shigella flexneri TaxID=623 RepID=UPI001C0A7D98
QRARRHKFGKARKKQAKPGKKGDKTNHDKSNTYPSKTITNPFFSYARKKSTPAGNPAVFCLWLLMNNFWRWNVNQPSA